MSKSELVEQIKDILANSDADCDVKIAALNTCLTSLNIQKQIDGPYEQKLQDWREKRLKQGSLERKKK